MKITVNDKNIRIFAGATVKDALRRYFAKTDPAKAEETTVMDQYGHELDADAPLHEGMTITLNPTLTQITFFKKVFDDYQAVRL